MASMDGSNRSSTFKNSASNYRRRLFLNATQNPVNRPSPNCSQTTGLGGGLRRINVGDAPASRVKTEPKYQSIAQEGHQEVPDTLAKKKPNTISALLYLMNFDSSRSKCTETLRNSTSTGEQSHLLRERRSLSRASFSSMVEDSLAIPQFPNSDSTSRGSFNYWKYVQQPVLTERRSGDSSEISITLYETETIPLFQLHGYLYDADSADGALILKRSNEYKSWAPGKTSRSEISTQTLNAAVRDEGCDSMPLYMKHTGCQADSWDIHDSYLITEGAQQLLEPQRGRIVPVPGISFSIKTTTQSTNTTKSFTSGNHSSFFSGRSVSDGSGQSQPNLPGEPHEADKREELSKLQNVATGLQIMDRVLVQNVYDSRQQEYICSLPDGISDDQDGLGSGCPRLRKLWTLSHPSTAWCPVQSFDWNHKNQDILAVGYGDLSSHGNPGWVMCWTYKNPEMPGRRMALPNPVTCISFANARPNLLAVGMLDGSIAIYDVRMDSQSPVYDTELSRSKHMGPVWGMGWPRHPELQSCPQQEMLVTCGADGTVLQWSFTKTMECQELMKVKRSNQGPSDPPERAASLMSRFSAVLCMEFKPTDSSIYVIGTDEGLLHRCSSAYNEQFLETYQGHQGPVHRVTWSHSKADLFLSCGEDWTVRVWVEEKPAPVLVINRHQRNILDVRWLPNLPSAFSLLTSNSVEVWELHSSTSDPTLSMLMSDGSKISAFTFHPSRQIALVGDMNGQAALYSVKNLPSNQVDQTSSLDMLVQVLEASRTSSAESNGLSETSS